MEKEKIIKILCDLKKYIQKNSAVVCGEIDVLGHPDGKYKNI